MQETQIQMQHCLPSIHWLHCESPSPFPGICPYNAASLQTQFTWSPVVQSACWRKLILPNNMLDGVKLIGKEPKLTSSRNLNQTFSHCQQLLPYTKSLEDSSGEKHCFLFLKLQLQSKDDSPVAIGNLRLVIKSMTLRWRNICISYLKRNK